MDTCPFCQSKISDEIALYGGNCPSCLIEVPGEEAVTNPGISVNKASAGGVGGGANLVNSAIAVFVVLGAVGGWWFTQTPESDSSADQSKQVTQTVPVPLSAHEDGEYVEEPKAESEVAEVVAKRPTLRVRRVTTPQGQPPDLGVATADASVIPTSNGPKGMGAAPEDVFSTIGAAPKARGPQGIILSDAIKVEEMIGRVLNRGAKQLEHCYTQGLKTNPGLKGAWYVDFTVVKEGKPAGVSVEALAASNPGIENCILRKVRSWRFQRITESIAVSRTFRFGM